MRFLILTAKFGMGHMSASKAIKETIEQKYKNANIEIVDLFDYTMPNTSKYMYKGFGYMLKYASDFYSKFYMKNDKKTETVFDPTSEVLFRGVKKLFNEKKPDVVISTFPGCAAAVSKYKNRINKNINSITCITDVSSHSEWIYKNTSTYFVACEQVKKELKLKGVKTEKIKVVGIPVLNKFKMKNSDLLNKSNRKNKGEKHLLIMGGGCGILPMEDDFYKTLNNVDGLKITIMTGKNQQLFEFFEGKYDNIKPVSFTKDVDKYMKSADAIITKPGGISLFESITAELPIICFLPELPNEIKNVSFIKDKGLGAVLTDDMMKNAKIIKNIMDKETDLNQILNNMKKFNSLIKGQLGNCISDLEKNAYVDEHIA